MTKAKSTNPDDPHVEAQEDTGGMLDFQAQATALIKQGYEHAQEHGYVPGFHRVYQLLSDCEKMLMDVSQYIRIDASDIT